MLLCSYFGKAAEGPIEGIEWLKELRRERRLPPLVSVAADGNELTAVQAVRLGAAAYLPCDLLDAQLLGRTLRKVLHASDRRARRSAGARRRHGDRAATGPELPNTPCCASWRRWPAPAVAGAQRFAATAGGLKVSRPLEATATDQQQFARIRRHCGAARSLIVDIYDYGVHDSREYLAIEYFPADLKQRLCIRSAARKRSATRGTLPRRCTSCTARASCIATQAPECQLRPDGSSC